MQKPHETVLRKILWHQRHISQVRKRIDYIINKLIVTFSAKIFWIVYYVFVNVSFSFRFKVKKQGDFFWSLFWSAGSTVLYSVLLQTIALIFQVISPQIFRYAPFQSIKIFKKVSLAFCFDVHTYVFRVNQITLCSVLLQYLESTDPYDWKGIILAISMFLFNVTASIIIHNFLFHAWTAGIRVRSILNSIVYRKVSEMTVSLLLVPNFAEILLNDFIASS